MTEVRKLLKIDGSVVDEARIAEFSTAFNGLLIRPQDTEYDKARKIWNGGISKYPGIIARCLGTADVVAAVMFAREQNLLVAVRSGGHNVAGRALCDGGLVIDLSAMRGVFVDAATRQVRAQAGARLADMDRETHLFGLAVPAGVISDTGIAGLTLGGGVGWLVRKYGLTVDNLLSCEVVLADGGVVTADEHHNVDLFWALRGGGGNFGIVTSFLYRAHPVSNVFGGLVVFPRAEAPAILRQFRSMMEHAPDELTAYAVFMSTPDGHPVIALAGCYCGDFAQGEKVMGAWREFGTVLMDTLGVKPHPEVQKMMDVGFVHGSHNYWKSAFLREMDDDACTALVTQANSAPSPLTLIVVEFYGGGVASRPDHPETAFAQRQAQYNIVICAQWLDPAATAANTEWTQATWDALNPQKSGSYMMSMLCGDEKPDVVRAAFGASYDTLAKVKAKYDPTNFFHMNLNIPPAVQQTVRPTVDSR